MLEEMRLLKERGHEVAIFSRAHQKNSPTAYSDLFPNAFDKNRSVIQKSTFSTACQLIYSRSTRKKLREVIRRFRPDIAHAHNVYGRLSLSVIDELKNSGIPVVMTLHDLKLLCPNHLMLNHGKVCERCWRHRYYMAACTRCHRDSLISSTVWAVESYFNHWLGKYNSISRFITPSKFLRQKCIDYGWDANRFCYIPNFVNSIPVSQSSGTEEYLLCLGRLSDEKGHTTLLKAYELIPNAIRLKIAGEGPARLRLEQRARAHRLPVFFTGMLEGRTLEKTLAEARAVVIPSECYENAPLSLIEAFAAGKPVLGSMIGGIPELIEDGKDGLLFTPCDETSLAAAIQYFFDLPPDKVVAMGQQARRKAQRLFNRQTHFNRLMNLYRNPDPQNQ